MKAEVGELEYCIGSFFTHTEKLVAHLAKINVSIRFGLSRSDFSGNSCCFFERSEFFRNYTKQF